MVRAKVLFSEAHEEDIPEKFIENLPKEEIIYDTSDKPITLEVLRKYTCAASLNSKTPFSDEEKKDMINYVNEGGGLFLSFKLLNESEYKRFKPNMDFIQSILGSELVGKRFLPELDLGEQEVVYERKKGIFSEEMERITRKRRVKISKGEEIHRRILYHPHTLFPVRDKFEIDEETEFILSFVGCEKKRVVLEREFTTSSDVYFDTLHVPYLIEDIDWEVREGGKKYILASWVTGINIKEELIAEYSSVGIINDPSQPGRVFALSTHVLFDEIEKKGPAAKKCQQLFQAVLIRVSEPTKYKLSVIRDEKVEMSKALEEEVTKMRLEIKKRDEEINTLRQKLQESREELTALPINVSWRLAYKTAKLAFLLNEGTIGEVNIAMKDTGESIKESGDPENYGSDILYFYNNYFDKEQANQPLPNNTSMEDYLKFKPHLIQPTRNLIMLLRKVMSHYEKMEE